MEKTIVLKLPTAKTPGFFKFLHGFTVFGDVMSKPLGHSAKEIDEALEWLVSLADGDKKEAKRLLLEMSAEQIGELIQNVGKEVGAAPDPLPSDGSGAG